MPRYPRGPPVYGVVEVGGTDTFGLDVLVRQGLAVSHNPRQVVADSSARYYSIRVQERPLLPAAGTKCGGIKFHDWLTSR